MPSDAEASVKTLVTSKHEGKQVSGALLRRQSPWVHVLPLPQPQTCLLNKGTRRRGMAPEGV